MPAILRRVVVAFCALLLLAQPVALWAVDDSDASPSAAHPSSVAVKNELSAVIDAQLAAFRANDFAKAYTFAAAGIRSGFPLEAFEKMVRTGYPRILGSATADYGLSLDNGDQAAIAVRITGDDPKAGSVEYLYTLSREEGVWKITGVSEIKPGGVQA